MGASFRNLVQALIAGMFAFAMVLVPAQHARAVLERAVYVASYAMPDGTLPDICADGHSSADGHGGHVVAPACMACVVMGAPGLADPPSVVVARVVASTAARFASDCARNGLPVVWAPQRARAPPALSIA